jgi:hypothetical protein
MCPRADGQGPTSTIGVRHTAACQTYDGRRRCQGRYLPCPGAEGSPTPSERSPVVISMKPLDPAAALAPQSLSIRSRRRLSPAALAGTVTHLLLADIVSKVTVPTLLATTAAARTWRGVVGAGDG